MNFSRRAFVASSLALAACDGQAEAEAAPGARAGPLPRLRDLADFPMGVSILSPEFDTPIINELASTQFDQLTSGYELKMAYLVQPDGRLRFEGGDRLMAFARQHGQTMHGHTLIWYADTPEYFQRLDGSRRGFQIAFDQHIAEVAGRYAGRMRGWDVVNEPVTDEGTELRESLWSQNLGQEGHFIRAFEQARQADPQAVLFTNDYHLELKPQKRRTFLRLIESMLDLGVPIGGIGHQSHLSFDLPRGAVAEAMRDIASLGLPIHVSELDVSLQSDGPSLASRRDREVAQTRLYQETLEAYLALPAAQQYGFTIWGVRDAESWVRLQSYGGDQSDAPLMFDDDGRAKPPFWGLVETLENAR